MHVSSRTKAAYVRAVEHALRLWSFAPACWAELTPRKPNFHFHILVWIRYTPKACNNTMLLFSTVVILWRNACEPLKSNCWIAKRPRLFARLSKINQSTYCTKSPPAFDEHWSPDWRPHWHAPDILLRAPPERLSNSRLLANAQLLWPLKSSVTSNCKTSKYQIHSKLCPKRELFCQTLVGHVPKTVVGALASGKRSIVTI